MSEEQKPEQIDILREEYNISPYLSLPFVQTHPTHLYTLARLFGLDPILVDKANILELGCAAGGNLIPMAVQFPNATFLGIDLAEKQIEDGLKVISDLNLKNITLRAQSISDFSEREGQFDYIICHGVYSWVDDDIRAKILEICRKNLKPKGIAYVSYNTYPGWNMVNSVRELMIWHTQNIKDPKLKAQHARGILKFITDGLQDDKAPYSAFLKNEIQLLSKQPDSYLLHEHLSSFNTPVYFYQFMEAANQQKLSYLSDAFLATMFTGNLPTQFASELNKINNIIAVGQYMDFIRNQRFRCTLLCHEDLKINRAIKTTDIENFYLQLIANPTKTDFSEKDLKDGEVISFTNGPLTLTVRHLLTQHAMLILHQERFKPIHYTDLCERLVQHYPQFDRNTIKAQLNDNLNLMRSVFAGLIQISSYRGNYTSHIGEKLLACPLARYQAEKQTYVTNRRHQVIALDPLSKFLLPALDGQKDMNKLVKYALEGIKSEKLKILDENKQAIKDSNQIKNKIEEACIATVDRLAKQALLIES